MMRDRHLTSGQISLEEAGLLHELGLIDRDEFSLIEWDHQRMNGTLESLDRELVQLINPNIVLYVQYHCLYNIFDDTPWKLLAEGLILAENEDLSWTERDLFDPLTKGDYRDRVIEPTTRLLFDPTVSDLQDYRERVARIEDTFNTEN